MVLVYSYNLKFNNKYIKNDKFKNYNIAMLNPKR